MYTVCMQRYNLFIPRNHLLILQKFSKGGLTVSEHIRVAITEYIERKIKTNANVSSSSSLTKGVSNG